MLPQILTEIALNVLLLMDLLVRTALTLKGLLGGESLLLMRLPGRTDLVLTTLKIDSLKLALSRCRMELRTGTIQGNVEKF